MKQTEQMFDELDQYVASIKKLRLEISELEAKRSLALVHINQYKQDFQLLRNAYKIARNWIEQNTSVVPRTNNSISSASSISQNSTDILSPTIVRRVAASKAPQQPQPYVDVSKKEIENTKKNIVFNVISDNPFFQSNAIELDIAYNIENPITCITVSSDGQFFAFSDGFMLFVVGANDGKFYQKIKLPKDADNQEPSRTITFSPTSTHLLVSYHGKNIAVYNLIDGTLVCTMNKHTHNVSQILFTKNGKYVVTSDQDGAVNLWSSSTFAFVDTISPQFEAVGMTTVITGMTESADGSVLFISYIKGVVVMYNINELSVIMIFQTDLKILLGITASPLDGTIATLSNPEIKLWNLTTKLDFAKELDGHANMVISASFSSKEHVLISGSRDESIIAWNTTDGTPLFQLNAHKNTIFAVCHSPVERKFATCSADGYFFIWKYKLPTQI